MVREGREWVGEEEAARRLGVSEETLCGLIDAGRLRFWRDDAGRVWVPGADREGREGSGRGSGRAGAGRSGDAGQGEPEGGWPRALHRGCRLVSLREAAARLGVGLGRVGNLAREGKLNRVRMGGRSWVYLDEVEREERVRAARRSRGGPVVSPPVVGSVPAVGAGSRPGGRKSGEAGEAGSGAAPAARPAPASCGGGRKSGEAGSGAAPAAWPAPASCAGGRKSGEAGSGAASAAWPAPALVSGRGEGEFEREAEAVWISAAEAAAVLGLTAGGVNALARRGGLTRRVERRRSFFQRSEVEGLARGRPEGVNRSTAWGRRDAQPWIGAGDRLIGTREAAGILGIRKESVTNLVRRGLVPAWQRRPGRQGSPLVLSLQAVERLACRPEYVQRRERHARGLMQEGPSLTEGWEEHGLEPVNRRGRTREVEVDRGEFLTTRQAALALNVSPGRVRALMREGRLTGHRRPARMERRKHWGGEPQGGRRWWFFRKTEVYSLLADACYRERHARWLRGTTPERRAETAALQEWTSEEWLAWWRRSREGRPPRCELEDVALGRGAGCDAGLSRLGRDVANPPSGWVSLEDMRWALGTDWITER